jgi:tetratricopeptide (TPR) repeat protein
MSKIFNRPRVLNSQVCFVLAALLLAGCSSKEESAQSYYAHAMQLISEHDDVKARIELRNALQLKDDMVGAWQALSQLEERNKNWSVVIAASRKISELDPKDIEARLRLARFSVLGGALDQALDWVNKASEIDPKNTAALSLKAAILLKLNDHTGAIQEARKALEIEPDNLDSFVILASEKYLSDDPKGALQILEGVPTAKKDDLGVILLKVKIFEKMGDSQQLEAQLRKLVELQPDQVAFKAELVKFYIAHQRSDEAEKLMRSLAAANPANTAAELEVVRFLLATKGSAAARQELDVRIKAGGNVFPFQTALADLDVLDGNFTAGSQLLEKLISSAASPADANIARVKLTAMQLGKKNMPAAEALIADILRADSHNPDALKLRASIRIDRGQLDDAIADLREALNDQPQSPELMMLMALAYERHGSIDLAEKQLASATKASGFAPSVGLNYVAFLTRRGNDAAAEDVLTELANRSPRNIEVLTALARERLARQNWIGANEVAEAIKRLGAQGDTAEQIKAAALAGEKEYDKSISMLEDAYARNKGAVQPMYALVRAYLQSKKIDQAESFLQNILKTSPNNAEALVLLGTVELTKNQPDQAVKSFKAAIERGPKSTEGYIALASFYMGQKNSDEALKTIQAGLHELPGNSALRLTLASVLELRGDFEGAITEYEAILKDQPGSMVVANNLASLLSEHRSDKASLERAYAIAAPLTQSPVPNFKDTLGWLNYQRGDYRNAIPLLEDAANALPYVALVHYHLGMSYIAVGQSEKALGQLKKASELEPNNTDLNTKVQAAIAAASKAKTQTN